MTLFPGARFVDLNGDGKEDVVYHRWISSDKKVVGAYINTGEGWQTNRHYIPPYHITSDQVEDLGARFVELNGDGLIDFVYYRFQNFEHQQKGAFINTGTVYVGKPYIYHVYLS